ncbi:Hypothetical predicted protein [Xyrichtys novacula]|uniref:Uncharacterized protein n=1 Tax=Xyrichtys novacula TaxID=13765 RepID=A0AAV1GF35_XYRNO|nr:Hypothetical predicted protein [Xyrichtys novacula]
MKARFRSLERVMEARVQSLHELLEACLLPVASAASSLRRQADAPEWLLPTPEPSTATPMPGGR